MSTDAPPPLLTIREAADRFHIARSTAYRLAATGELPTHRLGRSLRVRADEVAALTTRPATKDP